MGCRMLQEEKQTADQRVEEIETRFGQYDANIEAQLGRSSPPVRSGRSTPGARPSQPAFHHPPHADVSFCSCANIEYLLC